MPLNRWLGLAVVAIGIVIVVGGFVIRPATNQDNQAELEPRPEVGYPAPDFALRSLDGDTIRLSDYRGRAVFLNFWATWCGPCLVEMPEIARLKAKYDSSKMEVIGVDLAHTEQSPQDVLDFMNTYGYDWPVAMDTGEVTVAYKAIQIPSSFFIDGAGIIRAKYLGPMTLPMMEDHLQRALQGS